MWYNSSAAYCGWPMFFLQKGMLPYSYIGFNGGILTFLLNTYELKQNFDRNAVFEKSA